MRWIRRTSIALALIGLAVLAAWPYLPALKREWGHFATAWAEARFDGSSQAEASVPEDAAEPDPPRKRQIAAPRPPAETPPETRAKEDDPFLTEARRRAREDPEAAMAWLQAQSTGSERLRGMLEVVALWAAEDSEAALLWLESNAQGIARFETLNSGIELWSERDPASAAAWIDGMANDGSKATAAKSLAAKWVRTDPQLATAWIRELPPGPVRDEAAAAMTESWARADPEAASVWALGEAEFNGDTKLLGIAIETYTKQAPEAAEAFLREMASATDPAPVLDNHIRARAELDPAGTAAWLESIPPDDPIYADDHARSLMEVWATSDSIAASEWLSRQSPGPQRDAAIDGFAETIQSFEPEAAATWANAIADPMRRVARLRESILTWANQAPEAAADWLQSADLAPALRSELVNQIAPE